MVVLLATLFLPLIGAIVLLFLKKEAVRSIQYSALSFSVLTFLISLFLLFQFNSTHAGFQFVIDEQWIQNLDIGFRIGVDGLSLLLVLLTTFITPITILSSFQAIKDRHKLYYFMLLLLEFGMLGVFVALDTILFYVFWEIILIPMYFIVGIWGGARRIYAAIKFFLYTFVGSLFMLVAIIWLGLWGGGDAGFTANYFLLKDIAPSLPLQVQTWLFFAFALSFAIKVPLFPLHTWLPDAHVEAPTPGSVILAGILLKLGTYGLIRYNLELFPQASLEYATLFSTLAVIGIIYGALVAMVQSDIKKLVAYSSVSHLGFIVLGIFSMTSEGLQGALIQMINHGLSTGMLFLCVGILYERRHTREISEYGGIVSVMPKFSLLLGFAVFASAGLPGLNGFVGEFLTMLGAYTSTVYNTWVYVALAATGVILAAVYLLRFYNGVVFGPNINPKNHALPDLTGLEYWQLVPITILLIWIGIYPSSFLQYSETKMVTLEKSLIQYHQLSSSLLENNTLEFVTTFSSSRKSGTEDTTPGKHNEVRLNTPKLLFPAIMRTPSAPDDFCRIIDRVR